MKLVIKVKKSQRVINIKFNLVVVSEKEHIGTLNGTKACSI